MGSPPCLCHGNGRGGGPSAIWSLIRVWEGGIKGEPLPIFVQSPSPHDLPSRQLLARVPWGGSPWKPPLSAFAWGCLDSAPQICSGTLGEAERGRAPIWPPVLSENRGSGISSSSLCWGRGGRDLMGPSMANETQKPWGMRVGGSDKSRGPLYACDAVCTCVCVRQTWAVSCRVCGIPWPYICCRTSLAIRLWVCH